MISAYATTFYSSIVEYLVSLKVRASVCRCQRWASLMEVGALGVESFGLSSELDVSSLGDRLKAVDWPTKLRRLQRVSKE